MAKTVVIVFSFFDGPLGCALGSWVFDLFSSIFPPLVDLTLTPNRSCPEFSGQTDMIVESIEVP